MSLFKFFHIKTNPLFILKNFFFHINTLWKKNDNSIFQIFIDPHFLNKKSKHHHSLNMASIPSQKTAIPKNWNEKCALFGVWNHPLASQITYFGLYAQQHRGQEGAGMVSLHKGRHLAYKGLGLVKEIFDQASLSQLKGLSAIGHTRYSTRGKSCDEKSIQPLTAQTPYGPLAIAHNGNFVNFNILKKNLTKKGKNFQGTGDTECLLHLLSDLSDPSSFIESLKQSLAQIEGAYSLLILTQKELIAVRGPRGFRPLVLGEKKSPDGGQAFFLASETCAFDLLSAEYIREIEPGEILVISEKQKLKSYFLEKKEPRKACIFEHIYFARPDSHVFGSSVYENRKKMGALLAGQAPVTADFVIPVPDSGVPGALGYSQASQIPFEMGIIRNHYIGRTFIHPSSSERHLRVRIKLNPQKNLIKNRRLVIVDDSLVRGTTSQALIKTLRELGAKEIHFRITSPPITHPCLYGVDTPEKSQLIASQKTLKQIKEFLDLDSLEFLSMDNMMKAIDPKEQGYCTACFTGNYPTKVDF